MTRYEESHTAVSEAFETSLNELFGLSAKHRPYVLHRYHQRAVMVRRWRKIEMFVKAYRIVVDSVNDDRSTCYRHRSIDRSLKSVFKQRRAQAFTVLS